MNNKIKIIVSWIIALWASNVFLGSLFYKFDSSALEPQYIFNTIGAWLSSSVNTTIGELFSEYGAILIGLAELVTALVLLSPIVLWKHRKKLHCIGGLMASMVMAGAVFFHVFTPLGWNPTWSVVNESACQAVFIAPNSCVDTGLANAALSILILGIVMFFLNKKSN
ncbi:MAG: hypothetical protein DSY43_04775 [Gammaproteobacteria bacterium]|uniref:Uncharacterized protein n=1 Tax=endosymbiont of Bathymodiolus septemdierum str. Myojin knoll TaxID=1303921 RepID=A0A0P0URH3_9GAMM|nr:hypothetical protein [Bathymodiolus septemdierum thioautotrophic gill symbiont]RUA05332.1 MAG: hypothetical protein DSY43_04775 [Gammaproteobacteria bacterium]BAS67477.1 conserved hypothetical protein [endosymbiont of Bathymodiolus septemdierum str. Myojin knoll]